MDSHAIEKTAADWLAKRDSGNWDAADEAQLTQWLNQSIAHRVAMTRVKTVWQHADRLQALGAGVQPGVVPPAGQWRVPLFLSAKNGAAAVVSGAKSSAPSQAVHVHRRRISYSAVAAGVVLALTLGIVWYATMYDANAYRTKIGSIEAVPLTDGSKVTLNTDSAIRVSLGGAERRIDLERGEAFFDVAKDATRPFVVYAGGKRIVAVGTSFSVLRGSADVRVVVAEGRVRVESESSGAHEPPTQLAAGDIAQANSAGVLVASRSQAQAEQHLAWRTGYLMFRDTPLVDAVAEFNRYNTRKLVIGDPAIAGVRIGGNLRPTNLSAFVRVLEQGFPVKAAEQGDTIVLTAR